MQDSDKLIRKILGQSTCFADVLNLGLAKVNIKVKAENLKRLDPNLLVTIARKDGDLNSKSYLNLNRVRDSFYKATIMSDGHVTYMLFGVEAQSVQTRDMVLRIPIYNLLNVAEEVETIKKRHKAAGDKLDEAAFICGLTAEDRILPPISFVLNLTGKPWTAPIRLSQLYADIDPALRPFLPDFEITVISPSDISDEVLLHTETDIGLALWIIKHQDNPQILGALTTYSQRFDSMDADIARLAKLVTNKRLRITKKGGKVNMGHAFEVWEKENKAKGKLEGKLEGKIEGKIEGKLEAKLEAVRNIISFFKCSFEDAMRSQNIPVTEWDCYRAQLGAV